MIIGLTGGIASGKSSAASMLATWGAHVIDADKLGHRAYLAGTDAFGQVVDTFGDDVVGDNGEIDRAALGAKVFGGASRLDELTAIVWPAIRKMALDEIATVHGADPDRIVVLEAAVLIEAGWQEIVDQVWVVTVEPDAAITRATARDGVDAAAIQARIDAQLSNQERCAYADEVIKNSAGLAELETSLKSLWQQLGDAQK